MYVIPNAVFSKNTVLNVSRKSREWRFYEYLCVRVQDVHKVNAIIQVSHEVERVVGYCVALLPLYLAAVRSACECPQPGRLNTAVSTDLICNLHY
jgi:hypothetical protein